MICRADEHYTVVRAHDRISRLVCARCTFAVSRDSVSGANAPEWTGGKSGLPRYNHMRAAMVRHIHAKHADRTAAESITETQLDAMANDGQISPIAMRLAIDAGHDWPSLNDDEQDEWHEIAISQLRDGKISAR